MLDRLKNNNNVTTSPGNSLELKVEDEKVPPTDNNGVKGPSIEILKVQFKPQLSTVTEETSPSARNILN